MTGAAAERIAGAPITWGVSEVPGWGLQLEPERVLSDMCELMLAGTELGPDGYLPADPGALRGLLARHDLRLVGGFVTCVLHDPSLRAGELEQVRRQAQHVADAGGEIVVLAAAADVQGYEQRPELDAAGWRALLAGLEDVQQLVRGLGLRVALHPHVGTMVELDADVQRILHESEMPICLDTGHMLIGGTDLLDLVRSHAARIAHVHMKDVDLPLAARVACGELGFAQAVREGMFLPLGAGGVPGEQVVQQLERAGYAGWYVLEQDTALSSETQQPAREAAQSQRQMLAWLERTRSEVRA